MNVIEQEGIKLFKCSPKSDHYEETVATVWNVLLQSLQTQSPAAVTILEMLAFLDPDNVPRELLEEEEMGNATFDQAIYALSVYSLVATVSGSLSIHRLLQDVVRAGLQQQGQTS